MKITLYSSIQSKTSTSQLLWLLQWDSVVDWVKIFVWIGIFWNYVQQSLTSKKNQFVYRKIFECHFKIIFLLWVLTLGLSIITYFILKWIWIDSYCCFMHYQQSFTIHNVDYIFIRMCIQKFSDVFCIILVHIDMWYWG